MNVLIGCEESQAVCIAFRKLGHEAYSCDEKECSGGHPEWHIIEDILIVIKGGWFTTQAGNKVFIEKWNMAIFFPPCTFLTVTANRSFLNNPDRWEKRLQAVKFFHKLMNCDIEKIAIENPKGVISTHIRKPDQYIQPYHYGHTDSKMTGLWLKNLPKLQPVEIVEPIWITSPSGKRHSATHWKNPSTNNPDKAKLRSKTYSGIANAMAQQWG